MISLALSLALIISMKPAPDLPREAQRERMWLGFEYIAHRTDLSAAFLWSFYIAETGGTSRALVKGYNYGGIQLSGRTVYYNSVADGIDAWIRVFNSGHFDVCKCMEGEARQRCFYDRYYHRSPKRWHGRWAIEKKVNNKLEPILANETSTKKLPIRTEKRHSRRVPKWFESGMRGTANRRR